MTPYKDDPGKNPDTPNVILISCDHLRMDWLGCNGHEHIQTPQIDELAYEGINFRAAFSSCPMCVPARRIMMTGRDRYAIGMNGNHTSFPFDLGPKLAEVMTGAGYQTFASGKLHTWPQRNRIGFEDVQLNEEGRCQAGTLKDDYEMFLEDHGYGHLAYTHGLGNNQYGVRMSPLPEPYTTTHWTAQRAMEFLQRRDPTRPFFLHVSFDKPHPPITPPRDYYELYRDTDFPMPARGTWLDTKTPSRFLELQASTNFSDFGNNKEKLQQIFRGYAALVTHIDSMIGVLRGTLDELRLYHNTHIIFVSDHGDHLFDHGNIAKSDFFRGSCGIPYIVKPAATWSEKHGVKRGQVNSDTAVGLIDLMPSILELCDVPVPESVQGHSVVPLLKQADSPFRTHLCGDGLGCFAVTDGNTKYMWYSDDDLEFFFDTRNDPSESHDLLDDPAWQDQVDQARHRLIAWMSANHDPACKDGKLVAQANYSPDIEGHRTSTGWNNRGRH